MGCPHYVGQANVGNAGCDRSIRTDGRVTAMGRSCYSGVTLFCIIKGDLRLECPH